MNARPGPAADRAKARMAPAGPQNVVTPRHPMLYVLASGALLAPCYWQPRIQAGDLASHIYNTWLAALIENGRIGGVTVVPQTTNVLFDLALSALFRWFGPDWAQRLAVSAVMLVFAWGAFAFVSAVSGREAWRWLPCLAMLAYGWVYHMGFFNFYLALGLSFWGLALAWQPRPPRLAAAAIVFAVAYTAHALPVAWGLALAAYLWIARRIPEHGRAWLLTGGLAILAAARFVIDRTLDSRWAVTQLSSALGADQIWVFDGKYFFLMPVLLLVWGLCLVELLRVRGGRAVAASIPMHWCVLSAAGIFILPSGVLVPGFRHGLVYIAERMSLAAAVLVCAWLAAAPPRRVPQFALGGLALVFFVLLFRDERAMNRFEQRLDRAVAQLPAGTRVVSPIVDRELRADELTHMVDRACLGHCYSYANYEPSTAQFRVRAAAPNPYVISEYGDSWDLQNGSYTVHERDLPLFALGVSEAGEVTARGLPAGVASGTTFWSVLRNRPYR